jgi:hypothetical protein
VSAGTVSEKRFRYSTGRADLNTLRLVPVATVEHRIYADSKNPLLTDSISYVALPHTLSAKQAVTISSGPIDDGQFAAHELEFVRHLFGYAEFLRNCSRDTPVSDAFLPVLVMLLEIIDLNAPLEARRCVSQLKQILEVTFPDVGPGTWPETSGDSGNAEDRRSL